MHTSIWSIRVLEVWPALQPTQHSATLGGVVWCGVAWCGLVWWALLRHCSAPTQKVPGIEWIFSDHYTVCSRRDSNSRKVACMHTSDDIGMEATGVWCMWGYYTCDIKLYSASEYSDNEFVNILHDAALPHSDSPYSLYGSRIPPLKHG